MAARGISHSMVRGICYRGRFRVPGCYPDGEIGRAAGFTVLQPVVQHRPFCPGFEFGGGRPLASKGGPGISPVLRQAFVARRIGVPFGSPGRFDRLPEVITAVSPVAQLLRRFALPHG
jgi:hypothetical protein